VRNPHLKKLLAEKGHDDEETWSTITVREGSVQHLDFLDDLEKDVFKTAFELDQRWIIELAADRTPMIDQSQSVNIFLPADVHKRDLHQIHFQAWKQGVKSLYYCRSKSMQRAEVVATKGEVPESMKELLEGGMSLKKPKLEVVDSGTDYEECLACQ